MEYAVLVTFCLSLFHFFSGATEQPGVNTAVCVKSTGSNFNNPIVYSDWSLIFIPLKNLFLAI